MSVAGTVYLLHFDRRYEHAGHYLGWAADLDSRLAAHRAGAGARLTSVVKGAGIDWSLAAATWSGDRALERRIKRNGGLARCCPICGGRRFAATAKLPEFPGCFEQESNA